MASSRTVDRNPSALTESRAYFDAGEPERGFATARAAYRDIGVRRDKIDYLKRLFGLMRDVRFEPGVAFSLRELRKNDTLSFGEARRLFLSFERMERSALTDRYVGVLLHGLPKAGVPLRKALNLIWATGRPEAMLDYVRAHAPARLGDRETIAHYVAQFEKFKDRARAAPLLAHLVSLDPTNRRVRLDLARALSERGDHVEAARHCAAARDIAGDQGEVDRAAEDLFAALYQAITNEPSAEIADVARRALAALEPTDGEAPQRRAVERALTIVGTAAPTRRRTTLSHRQPLGSIAEAIALLTPMQPGTRPYRIVCDAAATLLRATDLAADPDAVNRLLLVAPQLAEVVGERFLTAADAPAGVLLFRGLTGDHAAAVWAEAATLAALAGSSEDAADFADRLAASRRNAATPQRPPLADLAEAIALLTTLQPGTRPHHLVSEAAATLLRATDLAANPDAVNRLLLVAPQLAEVVGERFLTADEADAGVHLFRGFTGDHATAVWEEATKLAAVAGLPEDAADFADRLAASRRSAATPQRPPLADMAEAVALLTTLQAGTRPHRLVSDAAATLLQTTDLSADPDALNRLLLAAPKLAEVVAERFETAADASAGVLLFRALTGDHAAAVWAEATKLAALAGLADDAADFAGRLAASRRSAAMSQRPPLADLAEAVALLMTLQAGTRPHRLVSDAAATLLRTTDLAADPDALNRLLLAVPKLAEVIAERFETSAEASAGVVIFRALTGDHAAAVWTQAAKLAALADSPDDTVDFAERLAAARTTAATPQRPPLADMAEAITLLTTLQAGTRPYRLVSDAAATLLRTTDLSADPDGLHHLLVAVPKLAEAVSERFMTAADAAAGVLLFRGLNRDHAAPVWTQAAKLAALAGSPKDIAEFADRLAASRTNAATPQRPPLADMAEAITLLTTLQPGTRSHHLVSEAAAALLRTADLSADPEMLNRLLTLSPELAKPVAERFMTPAAAAAGVTLFRALPSDSGGPVWVHGAKLAALADSPRDVADFAARLPTLPDVAVNDLRDVARSFTAAQTAEIDRFWTIAVATNPSDTVAAVALRSLYAFERSMSFYPIALDIATGSLRPAISIPAYIEAMRIVRGRAWRWNDAAGLTEAAESGLNPAFPAEIVVWTKAIFATAEFDYGKARALLDEGFDTWPENDTICFAKERALLAARFGKYGVVAHDGAAMRQTIPAGGHYALLQKVQATVAAAPPAPDALFPQYLIDPFFDRTPQRLYEPVPRSLVTIVAALAAGGSERQSVSLIEAIARDPRVATQSLLVRSVTPERQGFFLPHVEASGIPFHVFEDDPVDEAHVLHLLNEPPESALSIALPLLPAHLRTTICQLVPLLLERRPAIVHIRQDFVAAALACVLAGVPRFFIHRGSLTPNHWDLTVTQNIVTVGPMHHTYRRLVAWPGFGFINNALSGVQSDRDWTVCDDPTRFSLVHNIVDFARLGSSSDPDDSVRRSIGAAPGDLVIGAAFRFHRVKRPLLWLAAAKHVLTRHPEARFLLLGDGEMTETMTAFAEAEGFADRLHLPGLISDLGPWYRAMDVALLTSDREGLPNMLIEAQHFGVIPVSTNVGGAAETMEVGVTGVLVPTDSTPEVIGDAIVAAFDDRAWFERARAAAPDFVHDRFGASRAMDKIIGLYGFADAA